MGWQNKIKGLKERKFYECIISRSANLIVENHCDRQLERKDLNVFCFFVFVNISEICDSIHMSHSSFTSVPSLQIQTWCSKSYHADYPNSLVQIPTYPKLQVFFKCNATQVLSTKSFFLYHLFFLFIASNHYICTYYSNSNGVVDECFSLFLTLEVHFNRPGFLPSLWSCVLCSVPQMIFYRTPAIDG